MDKEIWKPIEGFDGYEISSHGRVRSFKNKTPRILKTSSCRGYRVLILRKDGKSYGCKIHRLVAEAFIPNPDNLPCVNHKDENKANNNVSNLEWCSIAYNNNYNDRTIRIAQKKSIPVYQYTISGDFVKQWESSKDAADHYGCTRENIQLVCRGKANTAVGFKWSY